MPKTDVAGLKIDALTKQQLLAEIGERIQKGQKTWLITPYSEFLYRGMKTPSILDMLNKADIAVADGIGVLWAKKFLEIPLTAKSYFGKIMQASWQAFYSQAAILFNLSWIHSTLPEKISGSNLVWDIAKLGAKQNLSIYLLGGFGQTSKVAAQKLSEFCKKTYNLQLTTYNSAKNPDDLSAIDDIKKSNADILLVAYGPIKQEQWILEHKDQLPCKLFVGLGGTFDYLAGTKQTPPRFMRAAGLEWLWRLVTQPSRMKRIMQATYGLTVALIRHKIFTSYPLRKNVACVVQNEKGEILVCRRHPQNYEKIGNVFPEKYNDYWQLPQGGLDEKEEITEGAKRELWEETGIKNPEIVCVSKNTNSYFWNNAVRPLFASHYKAPGQTQSIVYFKFSGNATEIKLDNHEFVDCKWIRPELLEKTIHTERMNLTAIVLKDLAENAKI